jgi:hypothetical protein
MSIDAFNQIRVRNSGCLQQNFPIKIKSLGHHIKKLTWDNFPFLFCTLIKKEQKYGLGNINLTAILLLVNLTGIFIVPTVYFSMYFLREIYSYHFEIFETNI